LEKYRDGVLANGASSVIIQVKSRIGDWSNAAGTRSLENQEPAQLTDQLHVGEITMAMVAVAVMKLVEEGKLQLDDPVTRYLPEFDTIIKPPGPVTVRSLLNHQSGMPDYWETLMGSAPLDQVLARRLSHEERLGIAAGRPWDRQGYFRYSGSNYAVLALLLERLRGRELGEILRTDIVEPLGLQNTLMAGPKPGPQNLLHGYVFLDGGRVDTTLPSVVLGSGDQGMISTVPDLNTLFGALAQGKLLNSRTVVEMYTLNQVNKEEQYGLGLQQRYDACSNNYYFGHGGDVPGYASVALTSTDGSRQMAIAVAFAPTSPPGRFDEPVIDLLTVALESLNLAC
jgi:D-alanyl-D-alanine carboxypeptidase